MNMSICAKSEIVFSTGGNYVTTKIAPKKVEDLILIKGNKPKTKYAQICLLF